MSVFTQYNRFTRQNATIGDDTYHNLRALDRPTTQVSKEGMFHKTRSRSRSRSRDDLRSLSAEDPQHQHRLSVQNIRDLPDGNPDKLRLLNYIREMGGTANGKVYKEFLKQKKMVENDKKVCETVDRRYKHFVIFAHGLSKPPRMENLDFEHILEKKGHYSRGHIIQRRNSKK